MNVSPFSILSDLCHRVVVIALLAAAWLVLGAWHDRLKAREEEQRGFPLEPRKDR